jgi:hypothetical protein
MPDQLPRQYMHLRRLLDSSLLNAARCTPAGPEMAGTSR